MLTLETLDFLILKKIFFVLRTPDLCELAAVSKKMKELVYQEDIWILKCLRMKICYKPKGESWRSLYLKSFKEMKPIYDLILANQVLFLVSRFPNFFFFFFFFFFLFFFFLLLFLFLFLFLFFFFFFFFFFLLFLSIFYFLYFSFF